LASKENVPTTRPKREWRVATWKFDLAG